MDMLKMHPTSNITITLEFLLESDHNCEYVYIMNSQKHINIYLAAIQFNLVINITIDKSILEYGIKNLMAKLKKCSAFLLAWLW